MDKMQNTHELSKQREKLRKVTSQTSKVVDTDAMIKQLISDGDTFKINQDKSKEQKMLPKWLTVQSGLSPAIYEQVWQAVKTANNLCDTALISQLFTTSGLTLDTLGFLWSLVNVTTPGSLTQQELYIMLAMIALVQNGYVVKYITAINLLNHPVVPLLNYSILNIKSPGCSSTNTNELKTQVGVEKLNLVGNMFEQRSDTPRQNEAKKNTREDARPMTSFLETELSTDLNGMNADFFDNMEELRKASSVVKDTQKEKNVDNLVKSANSNLLFDLEEELKEFDEIRGETKKAINSKNGEIVNLSENLLNLTLSSCDIPEVQYVEPQKFNLFSKHSSTNFVDEFNEKFEASKMGYLNPLTQFKTEVQTNVTENFGDSDDEFSDFQSAPPLVPTFEANSQNQEEVAPPKSEPVPVVANNNTTDKYEVFRILNESQTTTKEMEDEFGDFITAMDTQVTKHEQEQPKKKLQVRCLEACIRLLKEGLLICDNIVDEPALIEIFSDPRGSSYLIYLKAVYETGERLQRNFGNVTLREQLLATWTNLSHYYKYIPPERMPHENFEDEKAIGSGTNCKLCGTECISNCARYSGSNFHITCVNLFLHFVNGAQVSDILNM